MWYSNIRETSLVLFLTFQKRFRRKAFTQFSTFQLLLSRRLEFKDNLEIKIIDAPWPRFLTLPFFPTLFLLSVDGQQ